MNKFMHRLYDRVSLPLIAMSAWPTWIFTKYVLKFSDNHPWQSLDFTLLDWALGRTTFCKVCDFAAWNWMAFMLGLVYRLSFGPAWWH